MSWRAPAAILERVLRSLAEAESPSRRMDTTRFPFSSPLSSHGTIKASVRRCSPLTPPQSCGITIISSRTAREKEKETKKKEDGAGCLFSRVVSPLAS